MDHKIRNKSHNFQQRRVGDEERLREVIIRFANKF